MSTVPDQCCSTCEEVTTNIPGPQGNPGSDGAAGADGCSASTMTTAEFEMPGCDYPGESQVLVDVLDASCFCVGQVIYIENAGYFRLLSVVYDTQILLENLCLDVNADEGTVIPATSCVSVGGEPGADGTNGADGADGTDGINSFTVTTANFTQPAELATEVVSVADSSWAFVGQNIYVEGGGYYEVTALGAGTITLKNLEDSTNNAYLSNAIAGTIIAAGAGVSPGGIQGPNPETQTEKIVAIVFSEPVSYPSDAMVFNAWTPLDVNVMTETVTGTCTFTGPDFTLELGSYTLVGHVCVTDCKIRIRLRDTTASVDLLQSVNGVTDGQMIIPIFGAFATNGTNVLQFEYYAIDNGGGTFGDVTGVPLVDEVYRGFMFTKVS